MYRVFVNDVPSDGRSGSHALWIVNDVPSGLWITSAGRPFCERCTEWRGANALSIGAAEERM
jgi:hypothetical protein